jgi:hypothetical protein
MQVFVAAHFDQGDAKPTFGSAQGHGSGDGCFSAAAFARHNDESTVE